MITSETKLPRLKVSSAEMENVDRLGWAAGFSIKSYGVRIGIRSNDQALLERVRHHLPHESESASSPVVDRVYSILVAGAGPRSNLRRFNILYRDHLQIERSRDLDEVLERFESDLRIFVAELAHHRVFVHAGVVGWKGRAIVIPGRSYSGKSTLVAELVRAGATYYSDEYAVFDSRGRVHPFAKPLELRDEGTYEQTKVTVAELGGHSGTKPLPVGLVLMTHFKSGARWRPRKLTPGKGVLELLFNTVSARRNPERAMATLHRVTSRAAVLKGVRGNASELVPAMLARVENE
ncbi:MAG TPA: hypothetical protein VNO50_21830 [Pyrinomonadaceae bacterium]|nr:hypothetical protein [Pyrinomonadaceae bacterium]